MGFMAQVTQIMCNCKLQKWFTRW